MHQVFWFLARTMALVGGMVLSGLIVMTTVSIIGRSASTIAHSDFGKEWIAPISDFLISLGIGPVPGDFELVEAGIAFCIFSFLPWCQITQGHATVDLLTSFFSRQANRLVELVGDLLLSVVTLLITWRLYAGMYDNCLLYTSPSPRDPE